MKAKKRYKRQRPWIENYLLLKKIFEEFGRTHSVDDPRFHSLKPWISRIRNKKESLSSQQIEHLNSIEFVWDLMEFKWEENFKKLQAFVEKNGHARVPTYYEDQTLSTWVIRHRGKNPGMCPQKRKRLEELGFYDELIKIKKKAA